MMRAAVIGLLALSAGSAAAQDTTTFAIPNITITHVYPLVVHAGDNAVRTFQMEEGACLRGPLVFNGIDGKEQFKLAAGVDYPAGCSKDR